MARTPFLIKPSRLTEAQPVLHPQKVIANIAAGIETCVVLDLNLLNLMKSAVDPLSDLLPAERSLPEVQAIFNIPFLFLTPGMALGEADESYLESLHEAYEKYLEVFCPGYVDAPNAIRNYTSRQHSRKFTGLPEVEQQMFSVSHLALLRIHDILLSEPKASGEAKFDMFLEYMDGVANFVPALEAEIAKYCFSEARSGEGADFATTCKAIKNNFNKGGRGSKRVERILNGARDVMYLRSTALMDGKSLDGRQQDTWLLTCDQGIAALAGAIYFYPKDGEASKHVAPAEFDSRTKCSYWRYVDSALQQLLQNRLCEGASIRDSHASAAHLGRLAKKAHELEERVASYGLS
jgi:hypothetical protein